MRIGWTIASGDIANLSNDEQQDPDQDKLDGFTDTNAEPDFAAGAVQAAYAGACPGSQQPAERFAFIPNWGSAKTRIAHACPACGKVLSPQRSKSDEVHTTAHKPADETYHVRMVNKLMNEGYEASNPLVDHHEGWVGKLNPGAHTAANSDELATEPMGYDDNDMDDFNTGTTGPTVTQTDINPDNSFSGSRKLASGIVVEGSWTDVQSKAQRIYKDGGVRIISVTGPYVAGNVKGSEGVYETTLQRGPSGSIDQWTCSCPWFAYSFGRSGRWKKYEGRMCSHALALQYKAQSEGMFGREIKEDTQSPGWDKEITRYEAPPPKDWRASKTALSGKVYRGVSSELDVQRTINGDVDFSNPWLNTSGVGIYVTLDRQRAQSFSRGFLMTGTIPGNPKVLVESHYWDDIARHVDSPEWKRLKSLDQGDPSSYARHNGYDIVACDMDGNPDLVIINAKVVHWEPAQKISALAAVLPTPATKAYLRLFASSTDDEPRASDGTWTKGMGDKSDTGFGKITPGEARGDSKKVTPEEFDELAAKGKEHYDRLLADKRPTTAFNDEDQWKDICSGAYKAAQESWGGQTIDPATGKAIERSKGFSLQVRAPGEKQLTVPEDASEDEFNEMMERARKEYAEKLKGKEVYLGVFRDDDNNRIDFDPVTIVDTEAEVDSLGAYTHAVGGAYDFATGNGHFPPHVASLSSDIKDAVHVWSSIKVNNQKSLPNPEHDGFRYAFHQILGDVGSFRYNASNPEFMKGEHEATVFLKAFMDNQTPSHRPLYRAIGLHPAAYMEILSAATAGSLDLPPASWSANKKLTEQFGLDYMQGTKKYEERIIFVTRPGTKSWALGRTSMTGYEREHIVGGRFHVVSIKFPPETDNTTVITLQETEGWPEDFASTGDMIEHMAFDSAVVSPQDSKTAAKEPYGWWLAPDGTLIDVANSMDHFSTPHPKGSIHLTNELWGLGGEQVRLLSAGVYGSISTEQMKALYRLVYSHDFKRFCGSIYSEDGESLPGFPGISASMQNLSKQEIIDQLRNLGQLASRTGRYLTIDEARAGAIDYSLPMTAADHVDPHKGTMIAVRPPESVCQSLALPDSGAEPVEQLHVTLAYIGPEASEDLDLDLLRQIVDAQSQLSPYIAGTLSGHGTFENPDGDVSVVLVDSEELQVARALLVDALERAGIEVSREHGFVPHITLTYGEHGPLPAVDKDVFYFTEFIISPPSGVWERYELATNISLAASVVVADQENPLPPIHNAEPSWGSSPISQDDPTGSPLDADGETNTVLPGAQAVLDEEPEGALPSTDGEAGADGAQSDQDYYPTDEQDNTHLYGGEGAAPSTIAWLDPRISNKGVKGNDDMDIAAAARNFLMTSTAVKTFTYAEQQEIILEGEGVTASNLDRLNLTGTHYEALEQQLATAEALGEPVVWW
jgi:2'-5' RNA ligase